MCNTQYFRIFSFLLFFFKHILFMMCMQANISILFCSLFCRVFLFLCRIYYYDFLRWLHFYSQINVSPFVFSQFLSFFAKNSCWWIFFKHFVVLIVIVVVVFFIHIFFNLLKCFRFPFVQFIWRTKIKMGRKTAKSKKYCFCVAYYYCYSFQIAKKKKKQKKKNCIMLLLT